MAGHYSLKGIFTTMIGFVTWAPLLIFNVGYNKKGGQVTKPIIVVKIPFIVASHVFFWNFEINMYN